MALGGRSEDEIRGLEHELLKQVDDLGSPCGNVSLIRSLGWDESLYWEIRNRLLDAGELSLGRGRGGSVSRVPKQDSSTSDATAIEPATTDVIIAEQELYEPVSDVLENRWVKDRRFRQSLVEITAKQGRRETGGKWSRPDVTVASFTTLPYVPGKHFDVTTFEIKAADAVDVTAVYEALAHRRAAAQAYVLFHVPDGMQKDAAFEATMGGIVDERERHGIGVIVAADPGDYEKWDFRVDPVRHEPAPVRLNDFISVQLSDAAKTEITQWFR